jgi:V8-like Glu-specific endopeptidase
MEPSVYQPGIVTELRKLLAALYPTEADQRRLAAEARLTVGAIPFGSSAFNNWHQVLHHAKHNRALEAIVALAREEFPDSEQLRLLSSGHPSPVVDGGAFAWQGPANGRMLLEQLVSGKPSFVHVSHLAIGLARSRAVAKLVRADGGTGTGFLIEGDRLITNHHVLPDIASAAAASAIFNFQKATEGHDEASEVAGLEPARYFHTSAADDFTVVGVASGAVSRWGQIELERIGAARGDLVNIIQHPGGGPKQVGLSFDVVAFVGDGRLQYLTDTLPGSSGAPVFDRNWNLVALHHSGGWLMEPGSVDKRVYYRNQGILIERILDQLEALSAAPCA